MNVSVDGGTARQEVYSGTMEEMETGDWLRPPLKGSVQKKKKRRHELEIISHWKKNEPPAQTCTTTQR